MRNRLTRFFAIVGVLLVGLPVLIKQFRQVESRDLVGITLAETRHQEIGFTNPAEQFELGGLLFVPEGDGPFPAAVMIHGSGNSSRENRWYLTVAETLRRHRIVVLLPDKRGCEQSEGDWRSASFDALATDTVAAVSYLHQQNEVPISFVGIIGMSQGGHIAPLAATKSEQISFVINVVGSAVPMRDSFYYEETNNLRELGVLPGIANLVARVTVPYHIHVGQTAFWNAIAGYEPLNSWQEIEVPALILYGSEDQNTDPIRNSQLLRALGKPNLDVIVYEGSGHALESPPEVGNDLFRPDALDRMAQFIRGSNR